MTLLICPVREGDKNEELRYALRSWETNLILPTGLSLMTVGYRPDWLQPDIHVEGNKYKSTALAVWDNIRLATEHPEADRNEVIYMNDDFFCMDPVGAVLPVRRNISLAEHIKQFPMGAGLWWPRSLRLTADWLASEGYPSPDSYEVHRPLVAQPGAMLEALNRWGPDLKDMVPQWRTVYGTLAEVDAHPVQDAKLMGIPVGFGTPWISTNDQSWRRYALAMSKRFQKPSRWEIST